MRGHPTQVTAEFPDKMFIKTLEQ
ncbi:rCG30349 [Rattus norvegicus]|uniref:RCG30349 n=1 Tax=Rattus norvegicus TaxID=10116 RepID=A6JFC8_RAT|nr:rCG30349 [Rattus norvegicus]